MSGGINIDQLADAVMDALEDYRDMAAGVVKDAVSDVARESVYDMEDAVEQAGIGGSGSYKNSFAEKKNTVKGAYGHVVYSQAPHYRLAHLLENGHALRRGGRTVGRVKAFPHWHKVEEEATKKLADRIVQKLKLFGGG